MKIIVDDGEIVELAATRHDVLPIGQVKLIGHSGGRLLKFRVFFRGQLVHFSPKGTIIYKCRGA